jgi:hypothetical protein
MKVDDHVIVFRLKLSDYLADRMADGITPCNSRVSLYQWSIYLLCKVMYLSTPSFMQATKHRGAQYDIPDRAEAYDKVFLQQNSLERA